MFQTSLPSFVKIAIVHACAHRVQTYGQTYIDDTGDFIICPMPCYSNGTDS